MPMEDLSIIINWSKKNPSWDIYFWIDGRDVDYAHKLQAYYMHLLALPKIVVRDIQELAQFKDLLKTFWIVFIMRLIKNTLILVHLVIYCDI